MVGLCEGLSTLVAGGELRVRAIRALSDGLGNDSRPALFVYHPGNGICLEVDRGKCLNQQPRLTSKCLSRRYLGRLVR